jgi:hypothetical protein
MLCAYEKPTVPDGSADPSAGGMMVGGSGRAIVML